MSRFFIRFIHLLLFIIFAGILHAQEKNDYTILLNSGKFIPAENISGLTKSSTEFRQSLFLNKHYVTIQFKVLPTQ